MNVQNAVREGADQIRAQEAHESGQTHEIDLVGPQLFDQQLVVSFPFEPAEAITRRGIPRSRAISSPGALARLLITITISACSLRRAVALAIASKLEPLPEIRIPRRTRVLPCFH